MNLFNVKESGGGTKEVTELLLSGTDIKVERIVTLEPYEVPGEWYDQESDEWVVLLQGKAVIEFRFDKTEKLMPGDCIFIPAHKIHRISQSSQNIKCIWLAIHGNLK